MYESSVSRSAVIERRLALYVHVLKTNIGAKIFFSRRFQSENRITGWIAVKQTGTKLIFSVRELKQCIHNMDLSSSDDEFVMQIENLNEHNYRYWNIRAKGVLLVQNCWSIVEKGLGENPTVEERLKNEKAVGFLLTSVDNYCLSDIKKCTTAKEMWDRLKETRGTCSVWVGMRALREFCAAEMTAEDTLQEYWIKQTDLLYKIRTSGLMLTDEQAAILIAMGLPSDYQTFVRSVKTDGPDFNLHKFKRQLLVEESKISLFSRARNDPEVLPNRCRQARRVQGRVRCYRCHKIGHIVRNCPGYEEYVELL